MAVEFNKGFVLQFHSCFVAVRNRSGAAGILLGVEATMFHIINAFTRAAQSAGLDALQSYRLESIGGAGLSLVRP